MTFFRKLKYLLVCLYKDFRGIEYLVAENISSEAILDSNNRFIGQRRGPYTKIYNTGRVEVDWSKAGDYYCGSAEDLSR